MKSMPLIIVCMLSLFTGLYSQDVAITVYNQDRALVREQRQLKIQSGVSTVSFTDVAARIDPTSVHFRSLTSPDKLSILEQNFEYDLISADKILQKYIDESIQLITTEGDVYRGTLLNASGSDIVIRDEKGGIKIIKGQSVQYFDFPDLPEGLITHAWMEIYADTVTIGINKGKSFSVVIQNQEVANSFKIYAQLLWSMAKP